MAIQKFPFNSEELKNWFHESQRDLPWRKNPTPYGVWISEVMLQQTQVAVVQDYYLRWMARFPTVESLAAASLDEVIKMWEGLGYYSRARNLHSAAQFLMDHYEGILPASKGELSEVKGLGPYTIGAILSFVFHQKAAAVDGNVIRVLTRYFAIEEDVEKSSTKKRIWEIAEGILPDTEPWTVVEGLIELGAMVCKRDPDCEACPLQEGCAAFALGIQKELPKLKKKGGVTSFSRRVFVITHAGELLLKKGGAGKVMADLYEFPYVDEKENSFPFSFAAKKIKTLQEVEHSFTRFRVKLYPTLWRALERIELAEHDWIPWSALKRHPFSSGHRRILKNLELDHAHITH